MDFIILSESLRETSKQTLDHTARARRRRLWPMAIQTRPFDGSGAETPGMAPTDRTQHGRALAKRPRGGEQTAVGAAS